MSEAQAKNFVGALINQRNEANNLSANLAAQVMTLREENQILQDKLETLAQKVKDGDVSKRPPTPNGDKASGDK